MAEDSVKLIDVPHCPAGWLSGLFLMGQSAIKQSDCIVLCRVDAITTSRRHFVQRTVSGGGGKTSAIGSAQRHLCERLPPGLGDLHPRDLDGSAPDDDTLGVRGHDSGLDQLDQQLSRKSIREHQRVGAAVGGGGKEFEGEAAVGLGAAAGLGHAD
jgi:hypothetical protein